MGLQVFYGCPQAVLCIKLLIIGSEAKKLESEGTYMTHGRYIERGKWQISLLIVIYFARKTKIRKDKRIVDKSIWSEQFNK